MVLGVTFVTTGVISISYVIPAAVSSPLIEQSWIEIRQVWIHRRDSVRGGLLTTASCRSRGSG